MAREKSRESRTRGRTGANPGAEGCTGVQSEGSGRESGQLQGYVSVWLELDVKEFGFSCEHMGSASAVLRQAAMKMRLVSITS